MGPLANGGLLGAVRGRGTSRSDSIPMRLAGHEVRVSNGEGLAVLPAKTMRQPAALRAIEAIIEATNGKPPATANQLACGGVRRQMADGGILKSAKEYARMVAEEANGKLRGLAERVLPGVATWARDTTPSPGPGEAPLHEEAARRRKMLREATDYDEAPRRFANGAVGLREDEEPTGRHVGGRIDVPGFSRLPLPAAPQLTPQQALDQAGWLNPRNPGAQRVATQIKAGAGAIADDLAPAFAGRGLHRNAAGELAFRPPPTSPAADRPEPSPNESPTLLQPPASPVAVAPGPDKPPRRVNQFTEVNDAPSPGALLRDAYGNDRTLALLYQQRLDQLRAEKDALDSSRRQAAERPPGASYEEQLQAKADRFNRFVNESTTARLIHDLGTGGGDARTNAGKIEALRAAQARDAATQASELTRAGRVIEATSARRQQDLVAEHQRNAQEVALQQILGSPLHQQAQALDGALKAGQLNTAGVLQSLQQKLLAAGKAGDADAQARYGLLIQQLLGKTPESKLVTIGGGQEVDPASGLLRALPSQLAYTGPAPTIVSASPAPKNAGLIPSREQFKAHVLAKNPGERLTDEQITAAYQQQFGGR